MKDLLNAAALCLTAIFFVGGCERDDSPTALVASRQASIAESASGLPGFQFLAPIGSASSHNGHADVALLRDLSVRVCAWTSNQCGARVETLDAARSGPARLRASSSHFFAEWKTERGMTGVFRITVLLAGTELGYVDVSVVAGQTLPIRFAIAANTAAVAGPTGGSFMLAQGAVTLIVPGGAIGQNTGITAAPLLMYPQGAGVTVVSGTVYDFAPDGTTFSAPASLAIRYNQANIPSGVPESSLRLAHLVSGVWQVVPGSLINVVANTVSGPINGFSAYGVVISQPSNPFPVLTAWGSGSATINGVMDPGEWDTAASDTMTIFFPDGTSALGRFYLMNDATNVYAAIRFPRTAADRETHLQLTMNSDQVDGSYQSNGLEFLGDMFFNAANPLCEGGCLEPDIDYGGTHDGSAAGDNAGGFTVVELSHPLKSSDVNHDIQAKAGDRLALNIAVTIFDGSKYSAGQYPTMAEGRFIVSGTGPILSASGTAVIDGVEDAAWSASDCLSVASIDNPAGGTFPATLCVMNDASNLYFLLRYSNPSTDPGVVFAVDLDRNASGVIDSGDDRLMVDYTGLGGHNGTGGATGFHDQHWVGVWPCPNLCATLDQVLGGTNDGQGERGNVGGGAAIFEMSHPLASSDSYDINAAPGDVLQFQITVTVQSPGFAPKQTVIPASDLVRIVIQ